MYAYLQLLNKLVIKSEVMAVARPDRTNTGTASVFGVDMRFDMTRKFPLLPFRELNFKDIATELSWFLIGDSNVKYLEDNGCKWWSQQCDDNGNVGPMYGQQWRGSNGTNPNVKSVDQIGRLIEGLKADPYSRRHCVNSWDQDAIPPNTNSYHENVQNGYMAIAPCHPFFQCYVERENGVDYLSLKFTMRSSDTLLGLVANIASYGLLLHILADACGYKPKELIYSGGDVHLYANHVEQAKLLLSRANDAINTKAEQDGWRPLTSSNIIHSEAVREHTCHSLLPEFIMPKNFDWQNPDIDALCAGLINYQPLEKITARMAR